MAKKLLLPFMKTIIDNELSKTAFDITKLDDKYKYKKKLSKDIIQNRKNNKLAKQSRKINRKK